MTPGCTGKKSYSTPGMARKAAKKARRHEANRRLHAYLCEACGRWHLTSWSLPRDEAAAINRTAR